MVSIVGGLNLALCLFLIQLGTVISTDFKCETDGLFGNPDNCLKFFICAHGERQEFDCPQGMSWHGDKSLCDATDLSKCTATAASSGGSEDVFQQHLLSLLADFKPCHAGETTLATGTTVTSGTSENPGQGGNGSTPGNTGNTGGSTTTERSYHPPSNTTDGGSSTGNPGGNPTTPTNPGEGGNGSTPSPGPGDSSSTPMPTTPLTCPACPIPTEKPCPTAVACPALPTCPPAPKCDACPVATEKICPTVAPCPTATNNMTECPACPTQKAVTCPPAPTCPAVVSCPTPEPAPKCPAPLANKTTCDDGWKYLNSTESCYFVGKESLNATDAQHSCRSQGSDLASIHSDAENAFVIEYTLSISPTIETNLFWIGSYRFGLEPAQFANYDTTPMDYTHWRSVPTQQPDNYQGQEFCTAMISNAPYYALWDDGYCFTTRPYICKKPLNKI